MNRFKALWDVYWEGSGKEDAEEKPDACLFGTWFSSGQFPEQWALDQLENFVNVAQTPEPDHAIVEQLVKVSQVDIVRAVRILDRMIRGDREGWRIHGWQDSAMQILEVAMKAGGDARTQAEQVINYLGRRGYREFGELLTRMHKGRKIMVKVRDDGFEYDGQLFRSLTAIAKEITGSHWNGYDFFGLGGNGERS